MKTKLVALFAIAFMTACSIPTDKDYAKRIESGEQDYSIITIDSCEYIFLSNRPTSADMTITHKGNCKNPIHNCK